MTVYRITTRKEIAPDIVSLDVSAPLIARKFEPGQFVILRVGERGERIPITIAWADAQEGTIRLIVEVLGKTTKRLAALKEGDSILNLVGPLGKAIESKKYGKVICIGGGVGAAPLYPIVNALRKAGNRVVSIIGARTKELLILENEIRARSSTFYVTTDDGSKGRHGFVTDVLRSVLEMDENFNLVVAIGPIPMMKAVSNLTRAYGVRTLVSLNPIMLDGMGMCGACRVTVGGKTKFTCVDGPMFDGHKVDFDELARRRERYLDEEKRALKAYEHKGGACRG